MSRKENASAKHQIHFADIAENTILIEVLASMAEQERLTTHARQQEGIAAAEAKGKHLGRPKEQAPEGWSQIYTLWKENEITAVEAMKRAGLKKVHSISWQSLQMNHTHGSKKSESLA